MTDAAALLGPHFARMGIDAPMERMVEEVYAPLARWVAARRASLD